MFIERVKYKAPERLKIVQILSCVDYTSLLGSESTVDIIKLAHESQTRFGPVAALCVYPCHLNALKRIFDVHSFKTSTKICTVANFPSGDEAFHDVFMAIDNALCEGAQEIDVVLPYKKFLSGEIKVVNNFVKDCRNLCQGEIQLKVILETGSFINIDDIKKASLLMIDNGVDYIKTSTGKIEKGASLEAVKIILKTILDRNAQNHTGCKISGGIKNFEEAVQYYNLIEDMFESSWCCPKNIRFGASKLLKYLINDLEKTIS